VGVVAQEWLAFAIVPGNGLELISALTSASRRYAGDVMMLNYRNRQIEST
jgi:hypothetical protein